MADEYGSDDSRVLVAVSPEMVQLRVAQGVFNGLWQTSELAYGYALANLSAHSSDFNTGTKQVLGNVASEVWVKNHRDRDKLTQSIGQTLAQITENMTQVYRATMVGFFSAFEAYLNDRVGYVKSEKEHWGPFTRTLKHDDLRLGNYRVTLRAIVLADFCRIVRNKFVHEPTAVHDDIGGEFLEAELKGVKKYAAGNWSDAEIIDAVAHAKSVFFFGAKNSAKKARKEGKTLPIDYFLMLYSFTNLTGLAFEIEEAKYLGIADSENRIKQHPDKIRRRDMILP